MDRDDNNVTTSCTPWSSKSTWCKIFMQTILSRHRPHRPPAVEAPREPLRLLPHDCHKQTTWLFRLLCTQVLDVNLKNKIYHTYFHKYKLYLSWLVSQFYLNFRAPWTHPQENLGLKFGWFCCRPGWNQNHLDSCIKDHDVIVSQIILTKVWTLLRHREVSWNMKWDCCSMLKRCRPFSFEHLKSLV